MLQGDPWITLKVGVDKFDKEMCDAWNGELDTILVFVCSLSDLLGFQRTEVIP